MHGPTGIFCANLTPFTLQRQAAQQSLANFGRKGRHAVVEARTGGFTL